MADINVERKDRRGPAWLPWVLGLLALALLLFLLRGCGGDDPEPANEAAPDTVARTAPAAAPVVPPPAPAAAGADSVIPVSRIVGGPDAFVGQNASGLTTVAEVVSDRGFWIEEGGSRMFTVIAEPQSAEQRVDINTGQRLRLSGTVQRGGSGAQAPAGLEQEARTLIEREQVFLSVNPRDITIAGQGGQ